MHKHLTNFTEREVSHVLASKRCCLDYSKVESDVIKMVVSMESKRTYYVLYVYFIYWTGNNY